MCRRDPTRRRTRSPALLAWACAGLLLVAGSAPGAALDDYVDALRDVLTPGVAALFEDVRADLVTTALPFPERVRARLRPFFGGVVSDGVPLTAATLDRGRYTVDAEASRRLFALLPPSTAAITIGDVVAFAAGEYQPDCIEGVALIAHELVHVAQFHALGRDRFLERYFLTEMLRRQLPGESGGGADPMTSSLEIAAHCRQAEVCRALARAGTLPACRGRETPLCPVCRRDQRSAEDGHGRGRSREVHRRSGQPR